MELFRRKSTKLEMLLEKFLQNNGENFAKHQMREQADNLARIKVIERREAIIEKYEYFKFRISKGEVLSGDDLSEYQYCKWFVEDKKTLKTEKG
jgi:hypothetical protein